MIQPVKERVLGSKYCSYRVGGYIDEPYLPKTLEEASEVLSIARKKGATLTIIGGGANTIIASRGIRGITFLSKQLKFVEQTGELSFKVGAGMSLAKIAMLAQQHVLTGAEFMIGVPGTLGGAIVMNAGAMGQETSGIIDHVIIYNMDSEEIEAWGHDKIKFAYRKSSIQPENMVILGAHLTFKSGVSELIAEAMEKSIQFRQKHHPKDPNGGSVFKNPAPEQPAGRILDELGAKGWQEGGAMVSRQHANFIVNVKEASSTDILKLMLRMKQAVKKSYGIDIFPENRFIGDASEEEKAIWEELTGYA